MKIRVKIANGAIFIAEASRAISEVVNCSGYCKGTALTYLPYSSSVDPSSLIEVRLTEILTSSFSKIE